MTVATPAASAVALEAPEARPSPSTTDPDGSTRVKVTSVPGRKPVARAVLVVPEQARIEGEVSVVLITPVYGAWAPEGATRARHRAKPATKAATIFPDVFKVPSTERKRYHRPQR